MPEVRPFKEKSPKPTAPLLKEVLGSTFSFFEQLLQLAAKQSIEWNHSKTSGWMLKAGDRKKALFYLVPLENSFRVNLTMREAEKEMLLTEKSLSYLHEQLRTAKKYAEGFLLQFEVSDAPSAKKLLVFLAKLLEIRK